MMRFDLAVDDELRVYLMEANMSPNLSSAHFAQNQLLYEQVIYNLLNLVGVGSSLRRQSFRKRYEYFKGVFLHFIGTFLFVFSTAAAESMLTASKNIAVNAVACGQRCDCSLAACKLCLPCLSADQRAVLVAAYREHLQKGDAKRLFPQTQLSAERLAQLSSENQLHTRWFAEKCLQDVAWC